MMRAWKQNQLRYHADTEREYRDFEAKLREQIAALRRVGGDMAGVTERLFELLRQSPAATNSREVESCRGKHPSPERTAVALKWAEVAADEARYYAALHDIWRQDLERGEIHHHITDDEVPPFKLPEGWTREDLRAPG
jgi:hypothetical protein